MKLLVNGQYRELACQTAFQVREQIGSLSDIIILNGFQIDQDCPVKENDTA
jgi:sulfur carrier protein ThiS adenylyltransferase